MSTSYASWYLIERTILQQAFLLEKVNQNICADIHFNHTNPFSLQHAYQLLFDYIRKKDWHASIACSIWLVISFHEVILIFSRNVIIPYWLDMPSSNFCILWRIHNKCMNENHILLFITLFFEYNTKDCNYNVPLYSCFDCFRKKD